MTTTTVRTVRTPGTPKPWMNTSMLLMLRTPVLRAVLGNAFAAITVTGARTGTRYTTPVQQIEVDGHYVVLSQVHRRWWRNLRTHPEVELLVAGRTVHGHAEVLEGDAAHGLLATCLVRNPRVAKFYGIEIDPHGSIDPAALDEFATKVVAIDITPDA